MKYYSAIRNGGIFFFCQILDETERIMFSGIYHNKEEKLNDLTMELKRQRRENQ